MKGRKWRAMHARRMFPINANCRDCNLPHPAGEPCYAKPTQAETGFPSLLQSAEDQRRKDLSSGVESRHAIERHGSEGPPAASLQPKANLTMDYALNEASGSSAPPAQNSFPAPALVEPNCGVGHTPTLKQGGNVPEIANSAKNSGSRENSLDDVERHEAAESYSDWLREREALDNISEGGATELKRIAAFDAAFIANATGQTEEWEDAFEERFDAD